MRYINFYYYKERNSYFPLKVIAQGTICGVTNCEMFYCCSVLLCVIAVLSPAHLKCRSYGVTPSGTQKVDRSSSSGWLMVFT